MAEKLFIGQSAASAKAIGSSWAEGAKRIASLKKIQDEEDKKRKLQEEQNRLINDAISSGKLNKDGSEKGTLQKVGDFFGGIGNTVKEGFEGLAGGTADLLGSVKNLSDVEDAQKKQQKYNKYKDMYLKQFLGDEKKYLEESDKYDREHKDRKEAGNTAKAFKEQREVSKSLDKNAEKGYKLAQYLPGVSMGVEGLGTIGAKIAGDDSDVNKRLLKLTQGVDWDKLSGEEKKAALKSRDLNAALSTLDLALPGAKVATSGVKAGLKQGAKAGVDAAKDAFGKSVLAQGVKDTLKVGKKELAKQTAKSTVTGAATGAALGVGLNAVSGNGFNGWQEAASQGAQSGAIGGFLGSPLDVTKVTKAKSPMEAGMAASKLVEDAKKQADKPLMLEAGYRNADTIKSELKAVHDGTDDSLFRYTDSTGKDVTSHFNDFDKEIKARQTAIRDLEQQAGGEDLGGKALPPDGVDPSEYTGDVTARANAMEAIDKLKGEIEELRTQQQSAFESFGGVEKTLDNEAAKKKFKELSDELAQSEQYQKGVRSAYDREGAQAIDVDALNAEEANLKAGIVPDDMVKPFAAVNSADDVRSMMLDVDPNDSRGLIRGADEIARERMYLDSKLSSLYTKEQFDADSAEITKQYNAAKDEIATLPEPVQANKLAELNDEVLARYDDIESRLDADAPEVEDTMRRIQQQDQLEQAMIQDARSIQLSDPDLFRPVDNEAVSNRLKEIERLKYQASRYPDPIESTAVLEKARDSGVDIEEGMKTDPVIAKAGNESIQNAAFTATDNTGKHPGLGWFIGIPTEVLEKFGPAGKFVADTLRKAVARKESLDGDFEFRMFNWGKLLGGKDSTVRVAKALDGDKAALESLSAPQKQAYTEIKQWFKEYADLQGLPESARIKDYLPHMMNGKNFDEIQKNLALLQAGKLDGKKLSKAELNELQNKIADTGVDANTLAYIASTNNYTAKNGFLKKRKNAIEDYSLDLERILTAYHSAASNKIAYEPAIKTANKATKALTRDQNSYVTAVFNSLQGETDTVIEKTIDGALQNLSRITGKNFGGKGTTSRLSKGTRNAIYNATIGANPGSAVRNAQQMVNVYSEVGGKHVLKAAPEAVMALKRNNPLREEMFEMGVMSNRQMQYFRDGKSIGQLGDNALWGMFNATETMNRATAYVAGKNKHLEKFPNDIEGAKRAGADLAAKTNFKFSAIDIPVGMQGDIAKNFLQMQTYSVQQVHFIKNMIKDAVFTKGKDGKFTLTGDNQLKLYRFLGGNALFFGTIGAAAGMDWTEAVPFYNEVTKGETPRSPLTQILFGDGKAQPGLVETVKSGVSSLFSQKWDDAAKDADALARGAVRTLVPGGNQAVKSIEGMSSASSGVSTTGTGLIGGTLDKGMSMLSGSKPSGNIRFKQNDDAWSKFKASVLGQYSTEAGKAWVKNGMKNVPSSLKIDGMNGSDYIKNLPIEKQEQYINYYSTKSSAQDTLKKGPGAKSTVRSSIVDGMRDGTMTESEAIERASRYNMQVISLMSDYLQGNTKIPSRLMNDIQDMLIDVTSAINSSKRSQSLESMQEQLGYAIDDMEDY